MPLSRYDTEGGCKGTKNREKCKGKLIFLCFSWCFPSVPVPSPRSVLSSRIPSAPRPRPSCPFLADFIRASSASVPSFSRGFYPCLVCVRPVLFSRILSVPRLCPSRPFLADSIRASSVSPLNQQSPHFVQPHEPVPLRFHRNRAVIKVLSLSLPPQGSLGGLLNNRINECTPLRLHQQQLPP